MLYYFMKYVLSPLIYLIFRPKIFNREHLKVKGGAIFICNHLSMLDPFMLGLVSPRCIHYMAKKELFSSSILRGLLKACLAFPVDRKNADISSLRNALNVLKKGAVFGIFPEGKRSITGELDEFEGGAAFLAIRSGAPIIPIYISPESYRRFRPRLIAGAPIRADSVWSKSKKSDLVDIITDEIVDKMNELRIEMESKER